MREYLGLKACLILSMCVLASSGIARSGAPSIDREYEPGIGDVALLGLISDHGTNRVLGAECFVSRNDMAVFYESVLEQDDSEGASRRPDYYVPRAGTPAVVRAVYYGEVKVNGMITPMRYAKVEVLKGAFRGRTFFVMQERIYRTK